MFGLGITEIIFLAVLALIVIGPKQLPEMARSIGRLLNELKRSTEALKDDLKVKVDLDLEKRRSDLAEELKQQQVRMQEKQNREGLPPAEEDRQLSLVGFKESLQEDHSHPSIEDVDKKGQS